MLLARQVSFKHKTNAHGVASGRRGVHGGAEGAVELELLGLDGDNLQHRELLLQLLREGRSQRPGLCIPRGTLEVESRDVATRLQPLVNSAGVLVRGDSGVEGGAVQWPAVLAAWAVRSEATASRVKGVQRNK